MENKLKPCPFCGEELIVLPNGRYYSHPREQKCFGGVWVFEVDDEEFIKLWNTRKPMDKIAEQLEEQRKKYEQAAELCSTDEYCYYRGKMRGFEYSKEIVKAGE